MAALAIDHVQIAIPAGGEAEGRRFFGELLGLEEIAKPNDMAGRGGCWFAIDAQQLHLGVDADFRAARKAHIGLATSNLSSLRERLSRAGIETVDGVAVAGRERFFTHDPFGNRIEFIETGR